MKRVTIDEVMSWHPCENYTRKRVTDLFAGRKTVTALNILDMDIPVEDRIWAAVRACTKRQYVEFACQCAERVLPLYEQRYPDDKRPRQCIEVTRAYMAGDAMEDELREAAEAAARAAGTAMAAWAAGTAMAAWAARAAERQKQVQMLREILEGK